MLEPLRHAKRLIKSARLILRRTPPELAPAVSSPPRSRLGCRASQGLFPSTSLDEPYAVVAARGRLQPSSSAADSIMTRSRRQMVPRPASAKNAPRANRRCGHGPTAAATAQPRSLLQSFRHFGMLRVTEREVRPCFLVRTPRSSGARRAPHYPSCCRCWNYSCYRSRSFQDGLPRERLSLDYPAAEIAPDGR